MELKSRRCVPCEGGVPRLDAEAIGRLRAEIMDWAWTKPDGDGGTDRLTRTFRFSDFLGAMAFVNKVAAIAEEQGHHPDFCVHYSKVDVSVWTHAVSGLSENDFILAAKIDAI